MSWLYSCSSTFHLPFLSKRNYISISYFVYVLTKTYGISDQNKLKSGTQKLKNGTQKLKNDIYKFKKGT